MRISNLMLMLIFMISSSFTPVKHNVSSVRSKDAAPAVEAWFFRAVSGYPAAVSFEPVVLFKNGDYVDISEEPVETLDVAADKSKRPAAWGKWTKQGEVFNLTNYKGKNHDYKLGSGNWFPAYAYTPSIKLKTKYERTSGGDYGNGTHALAITKINFVDATHFNTGMNMGISTPSAKAGRKTAGEGTYSISGHTITLTFSDGKVQKRSFAIGASGSPAKPSVNIIFIGGDAYTDAD